MPERLLYPLLGIFLFVATVSTAAPGWNVENNGQTCHKLPLNDRGEVCATLKFPGSALLYQKRDRKTFRFSREDFQKKRLQVDVKIESPLSKPLRGNFFVKDKDGIWFQGPELMLHPGEWQTVALDLTRDGNMLHGVGHSASWNSNYAVNIMDFGLSLYSEEKTEYRISCRNMEFSGSRESLPLRVHDLRMPSNAQTWERFESTFDLSREYFNPFDPDEIAVDVEAESPSGKMIRFPAFYSQDFIRKRHFTREIIVPSGKAHWTFRFTPQEIGTYKLRLNIDDKSSGTPENLVTPWQTLAVVPGNGKGFVRVSAANPNYYELSTGEFFYPVGINVHTNIDLRSESSFKFGHLPDRGTYDYDDYLDVMGKNGINTVEIWMAPWTFSLEWSCDRPYYYGLGRYNMANAWRLDHILNYAQERNIYIHLVMGSHGQLSSHSDQEWDDSPYNKDNDYAEANGGFISDPKDFFSNPEAIKLSNRRNRYVAARWGAQTNIFAFELWSEVNLISGFQEIYDNGKAIEWHVNAARNLKRLDTGKHIIATHFCGDYANNLRFRRFYDLPEIEHVVGDAYRDPKVHFLDLLDTHARELTQFKRPILITEYGGTPSGSDKQNVIADIHAGLWGSFFMKQAGTPFLWWHDFVHINKLYDHYHGLAKFIADIDPREKSLIFKPLSFDRFVIRPSDIEGMDGHPPALLPSDIFSQVNGLAAGTTEDVCGWIYFRDKVHVYPAYIDQADTVQDLKMRLPWQLTPGKYIIEFFDTISGDKIFNQKLTVSGDGTDVVSIPPFNVDIAFKLRRCLPYTGMTTKKGN